MHLAPNANGLLRRWGIYAEETGACNMTALNEFASTGGLLKRIDLTMPNKMWQHPWQLVHRGALHERLKKVATAPDAPGSPATLHTASKVLSVDADACQISLGDGQTAQADLILGADGIYVSDPWKRSRAPRTDIETQSKTRKALDSPETRLFGSGKAAFRFLLPRSVAMEDPVTKPLVEQSIDSLSMWYGDDRRVVMYPCNNNDTLNFVLIHPDAESHAGPSDGPSFSHIQIPQTELTFAYRVE